MNSVFVFFIGTRGQETAQRIESLATGSLVKGGPAI